MDIWGILEYTISVTIIGLLIWGMKLIFHDKLDARWHCFIWLALLVRIIVPVHFRPVPTPLSVFQELPIGNWIEMGRILAEKRGHGELFDTLGRVYLWGAGLLGAFYLAVWIVLRIQVALAPRADEAVREYVDGIAAKYGLKSCRDIRVRRTGTPYICGLWHPVLVLSGTAGLPEERIILHELLHRKYRDVLVNIAVHAVRVVNWFNPFAWLLTAAVLNDSEALCDQRVLERCAGNSARDYGELLIAMGEGQKRNPVRIGTSNMASSYRNMKTRIRRIRDFSRVPGKIGVVTLCITLMLSVSAIGSASGEACRMEIPQIDTAEDLERALLYARCYHAHTPQEAIYLFLRACQERSTVYRMAVMPEEEIARYEEFSMEWFQRQDALYWSDLSQGEEAYPAYFPAETGSMPDYRIYNLVHDEKQGSAMVYAASRQSQAGREWRLELTCEDGWKVWLAEEILRPEEAYGAYAPEALLSGSALLGDFRIELSAYNEGSFQQLEKAGQGSVWQRNAVIEEESYPQYFSTEYKCRSVTMSYLGQESLEGHTVKVLTTDLEKLDAGGNREHAVEKRESGGQNRDDAGAVELAGYREELRLLAGEASGEGQDAAAAESCGRYDTDGNGCAIFDGGELAEGAPRLVCGGGNGYSQPGHCWKKGDRIGVLVQIYIDGKLAEEGEVWSGNH